MFKELKSILSLSTETGFGHLRSTTNCLFNFLNTESDTDILFSFTRCAVCGNLVFMVENDGCFDFSHNIGFCSGLTNSQAVPSDFEQLRGLGYSFSHKLNLLMHMPKRNTYLLFFRRVSVEQISLNESVQILVAGMIFKLNLSLSGTWTL